MSNEQPTAARYASGETPMVGDVVRCDVGFRKRLLVGEQYTVTRLAKDVVFVNDKWCIPERFTLLRKETPDPVSSGVTMTRRQAEDKQHADLFSSLAALEAENARLREAFFELAGGSCGMRSLLERFWNISEWWVKTNPAVVREVPLHIIALQEAMAAVRSK